MLTCMICGHELNAVNAQHLKTHGIITAEYKRMYPAAITESEYTRKKKGCSNNRHGLGHVWTVEQLERLRAACKTPEHCKNVSEGRKRYFANPDNLARHIAERKIAMNRPEVKKRISDGRKRYLSDPENLRKHINRQKDCMSKPLARLHISANRTGIPMPEWAKEKKRELMKDPARRAHLSEMQKRNWQKEEYRNTQPKKAMDACALKPTRPEIALGQILGQKWQYVGDSYLWIAGKCPDFWDGGNNLCECFGDYWHKNDDSKERIAHFNKYGYNCLIIWEHELKDIEALKRELAPII